MARCCRHTIILFSLLVIWCLGVRTFCFISWNCYLISWAYCLITCFISGTIFFSHWILLSEIGRNKLWKLESNQKIFKKSNKFTWQRQKSEGKLNKNSLDKAQTMPLFRVYTQVSLKRRGGWKIPKRKQRHLFFAKTTFKTTIMHFSRLRKQSMIKFPWLIRKEAMRI